MTRHTIEELEQVLDDIDDWEYFILYWARDRFNLRLRDWEHPKGEAS